MPDFIPIPPADPRKVPLPRPDPRTMQGMVYALLAKSKKPQGIPLPRPDPRDWMTRAVTPQGASEEGSMGAIHPDTYLNTHGVPFGSGVDNNVITDPGIHNLFLNSTQGKQRPLGMPPPVWQQDVSNGLFGVPAQHLQQMAGDVVPFPKSLHDQDVNRFKGGTGPDVPIAVPFDPNADMTGGGKVVRLPWIPG